MQLTSALRGNHVNPEASETTMGVRLHTRISLLTFPEVKDWEEIKNIERITHPSFIHLYLTRDPTCLIQLHISLIHRAEPLLFTDMMFLWGNIPMLFLVGISIVFSTILSVSYTTDETKRSLFSVQLKDQLKNRRMIITKNHLQLSTIVGQGELDNDTQLGIEPLHFELHTGHDIFPMESLIVCFNRRIRTCVQGISGYRCWKATCCCEDWKRYNNNIALTYTFVHIFCSIIHSN